jgi:hypothetical protein
MGSKALRKLQFGRESTAGTAVAATDIWRGEGELEDPREVQFVQEDVGLLVPTDRSYIPRFGARIGLVEVEATFEQICHILEMAIKTATASQDGAGSLYIYDYALPTTAKPTIKTYTFEFGDDDDVEEAEYVFCESFSLTGRAGEAVRMSASLMGRQVVQSAFTAALTLDAVDEMLFGNSKLYIDAVGDGFGSTLVSDTLLAFTLNWNTGIRARYGDGGQLYFDRLIYDRPEVTLDLTFEHNASAVSEKSAWRNETARAVRWLVEGPDAASAGTTYSKKTMFLDLAGKWTRFSTLGEDDGNNTVDATLAGRYNGTLGEMGGITVVNELSSL